MQKENDLNSLLYIEEDRYDLSKIPPDPRMAELHRKAYQFYRIPYIDSPKCPCCGMYLGYQKYAFCSDLKITSDCNSPMFYFYLLKWMLFQLVLIQIFFVWILINQTKNGQYCEQNPNCDPNSGKALSIWNLVSDYHQLSIENNNQMGNFYITTILLLFIGNVIWIKKYKEVGLQTLILKLGYQILRAIEQNIYPASVLTPNVIQVLINQAGKYYINVSIDYKKYEELLFEKSKLFYLQEQDTQKRKQKLIRKIWYDQIIISRCVKQITLIFFDQYSLEQFQKVCPNYEIGEVKKGSQICKIIYRGFFGNLIALSISYLIMITIRAISLFNKQTAEYLQENNYNEYFLYIPNIFFSGLQLIVLKLLEKLSKKLIYKKFYFLFNTYLVVVLVILPLNQGGWNDIYKIHLTSNQDAMLQDGGPIDNIETTTKFICLLPLIMWVFQIKNLWAGIKRSYKTCCGFNKLCQIEANMIYQKEELDFNEKRMSMYKFYLFCLAYSMYYPYIVLFTILAFIVIYIIDKNQLIRDSAPIKRNILDDYLTVIQLFSIPIFAILSMLQILLFYTEREALYTLIFIVILFLVGIRSLKRQFQLSQKLTEQELTQIIETQLDTLNYEQGFDSQKGQYQIDNAKKMELYKKIEKKLKNFRKDNKQGGFNLLEYYKVNIRQ